MRKTKYNAKKTIVDGMTFHSRAEADRYKTLKILEKTGEIANLATQTPFVFEFNSKKIFTYYADFTYNSNKGYIVEDVKGMRTAVYKLKKKLIEARYNITITEIGKQKRINLGIWSSMI